MPAQWTDFKLVRERVGMLDILEHYGISIGKIEKGVVQFKISCPFHEDSKPSCSINTKMNAFKCFGCGVHGNIFKFVRLKEGIDTGNDDKDDRAACLLIQEWFNIEVTRPSKKATIRQAHSKPDDKTETKETAAADTKADEKPADTAAQDDSREAAEEKETNPPLKGGDSAWFPNRDPEHPFLTDTLELHPDTIRYFRIGYHTGKGMMAGRIIIPIWNEKGELVAYAGRWPGEPPEDEPKYKLPPAFKKSHVVYHLHKVKEPLPDEIIVVEGFFDVMQLWQEGVTNVVALMGSSLSPQQEQLILDAVGRDGRIILSFDTDEAGQKCTDDCLRRFSRQVYVKVEPFQDLMALFR